MYTQKKGRSFFKDLYMQKSMLLKDKYQDKCLIVHTTGVWCSTQWTLIQKNATDDGTDK